MLLGTTSISSCSTTRRSRWSRRSGLVRTSKRLGGWASYSSMKPSPSVAAPCGSRSTRRTSRSRWLSAPATLIAVVVLPTPPFPEVITIAFPANLFPPFLLLYFKIFHHNIAFLNKCSFWFKIFAFRVFFRRSSNFFRNS